MVVKGRPEVASAPLQVAVARLLGYRWPEQSESDDLDDLVDGDGIVCLPSVAGEAPAADRMMQVLAAQRSRDVVTGESQGLLKRSGSKKKNLAEWLRDGFSRSIAPYSETVRLCGTSSTVNETVSPHWSTITDSTVRPLRS